MTFRSIPQEVIDAASKEVVRPFFAVDLEFDSPNELHFWSGYGDLVRGGVTYTGAGELLQISEIRESSDIASNGATITLSGIPSELITLALDEPYQGRVCRIWLGVIDFDLALPSNLLIDTGDYLLLDSDTQLDLTSQGPSAFFELFTGYMDQMNIEDGPSTATIAVSIENKLIDLERPRVRRYTDNNQKSRFPGDLAFEFVTRIQSESLTWGS